MVNVNLRLVEKVAGDFFVDRTCIDCEACRQIAPAMFRDHSTASSVYRQPTSESESEIKVALMAIAACHTGSIGTGRDGKYDLKVGVAAFP